MAQWQSRHSYLGNTGVMEPKPSNSPFLYISINMDLSSLANKIKKTCFFLADLQHPIIESEETEMTEVFTKLNHLNV